MRITVELYREQKATVEIDTADWPRETEGWEALNESDLRREAGYSAWELVELADWDDIDSDVRSVAIE